VNNVYVSAQNHGFDALAYLHAVPVEPVQEIHLSEGGVKLLVIRRGLRVMIEPLSEGECALLQALAAKLSFAQACTAALAAQPDIDIAQVIEEVVGGRRFDFAGERAIHCRVADLLSLDVDLLFYDTTSVLLTRSMTRTAEWGRKTSCRDPRRRGPSPAGR
jgi:hypothetical protein